MAEIRLNLKEYDELKAKHRSLQAEINRLETELDSALTKDSTGRIPELTTALLYAYEIIRFAVGNLDPRTIRGWPHESLNHFADALQTLPGAPVAARDTALEFRVFAREAALLERERRLRPEAYPEEPSDSLSDTAPSEESLTEPLESDTET